MAKTFDLYRHARDARTTGLVTLENSKYLCQMILYRDVKRYRICFYQDRVNVFRLNRDIGKLDIHLYPADISLYDNQTHNYMTSVGAYRRRSK